MQRVRLATQLFSHNVATVMKKHLPRRGTQAAAVETIDQWFDLFNSRVPYSPKSVKCAFGLKASCQDATLLASERLITSARKCVGGNLSTRGAMLPFQVGMLRCISSLWGLTDDLRSSVEGFSYIMTSRLQQDCVENLFLQIRSLNGAN